MNSGRGMKSPLHTKNQSKKTKNHTIENSIKKVNSNRKNLALFLN